MWSRYAQGESIGSPGSENGIILRDEINSAGYRVTLEEVHPDLYAITLGGGFVHTCFFSTRGAADHALREIQEEMDQWEAEIEDPVRRKLIDLIERFD